MDNTNIQQKKALLHIFMIYRELKKTQENKNKYKKKLNVRSEIMLSKTLTSSKDTTQKKKKK